jgi:hypothetical protein
MDKASFADCGDAEPSCSFFFVESSQPDRSIRCQLGQTKCGFSEAGEGRNHISVVRTDFVSAQRDISAAKARKRVKSDGDDAPVSIYLREGFRFFLFDARERPCVDESPLRREFVQLRKQALFHFPRR